jgi:opacity protein-like surface antigen
MMNGRFGGVLLSAAGLMLVAANGFAQSEDSVGEVGAYAGVSMGSLGARPVFGGTTGIAYKWAVGMIDTSFIPAGNRTLRHYAEPAGKSELFDFNFTVQIKVPASRRWQPYGVFGPAMLYNRFQLQRTRPNGTPYMKGLQDFKFGWDVGAGVRYYAADNWGVRAEYRYTITAQNFGRITLGVFRQFDLPWPFLPRNGRRGGQGVPY